MRGLDLIVIHLYKSKSAKLQDGKTSGVHLVKIGPLQSSFRHNQFYTAQQVVQLVLFSLDKSD